MYRRESSAGDRPFYTHRFVHLVALGRAWPRHGNGAGLGLAVSGGNAARDTAWPGSAVSVGNAAGDTAWPGSAVSVGNAARDTAWPGLAVSVGNAARDTAWPGLAVSVGNAARGLRPRAAFTHPTPQNTRNDTC